MNIVYAVNDAYVRQLLVSMVSVLEHNTTERNIQFYILSSDFSFASKDMINALKNRYKNCNVAYIVPERKLFEKFKLNISYISVETYFRYIIADLISDIDKCLYLDADLVVNGCLSELYDLEIENYYCAGARDIFIDKINYKEKIKFDKGDLYVNAGVLLFNLSKMRQDRVSLKLIENTRSFEKTIEYQDQDIINITFKGKIKEADSTYNFASANVVAEKNKRGDAIIIHYTGPKKPWHHNCKNKMRYLYTYYEYIAKCVITKKNPNKFLMDLLMLWHHIFIRIKR